MENGKYQNLKKEGDNMRPNEVKITVPSSLENLSLIRAMVKTYLEIHQVSQDSCFDTKGCISRTPDIICPNWLLLPARFPNNYLYLY